MAIPSINNLVRYVNNKLTGLNWNANLQAIVNWFTDGTADLTINSLTTNSDIETNGTINATGNITSDGYIIGNGSLLTDINQWKKNFIINGGCLIKNNADYTLIKDVYGESVDNFQGMATGTLVSAGTLTQTSSANCGITGYAIKFDQVSLTGAGIIYLRHRIYSKNAVSLRNSILSFSSKVYQNTGGALSYYIYINKANSLDNFTAITTISSSIVMVPNATATDLNYENIAVDDCTNGLEILIVCQCGAITLKNFEFTELQLEINSAASSFEYRPINVDIAMNNYSTSGALTIKNKLNLNTPTSATIASGAITYSAVNMLIDTEGSAASDDLTTINGGVNGDILIISEVNAARDITIKHGTGNIKTSTGTDLVFTDTEDKIILQYDGSNWVEIARALANDFKANKITDGGNIYYPNGIFKQWGISGVLANNTYANITLPITYSNTCLFAKVSGYSGGSDTTDDIAPTIMSYSTSTLRVCQNTSAGSYRILWEVIGY